MYSKQTTQEGTNNMILEVAMLNIKPGLTSEFEINFKKASKIISGMKGYLSHTLKKCLEDDHKYILLVEWQTLEDHTVGFRQSEDYQQWKALLHHFYDPFPTVEHYVNPGEQFITSSINPPEGELSSLTSRYRTVSRKINKSQIDQRWQRLNDNELLNHYLAMRDYEAGKWNLSPESLYLELETRDFCAKLH